MPFCLFTASKNSAKMGKDPMDAHELQMIEG